MHSPQVHSFLLKTPPAFSFTQTLAYLSRSPNECLFRTDANTVTRCIPAAGQRPVVTIGAEPDGSLRLTLCGVSDDSRLPAVREAAARYVADWLDLQTDLEPFLDMASRDPLLREPAERFRGLRLVGVPDLYEALGWAILGQQINLPFAYTLKRRLVEAYGETVPDGEGGRLPLFPSAETIASLQVADLLPLKMTAKKAEYLIGTAALVAEGKLSKEGLQETGSAAAAERMLTSVRGIGPWTAHYVAMRNLRFREAFPIQDVGLHLAIQRALGMDRKPTLAEIRRLSAGWNGWEAYATFYLWKTLY